jgi:hypothetical protein
LDGLATAERLLSSDMSPSARLLDATAGLSPGALDGRREEEGIGDVFRLLLSSGGPGRWGALPGERARMSPFGCAANPTADADADADADASAYWACSCDMARVVWREKEPGCRAGEEAADAARAAALEN